MIQLSTVQYVYFVHYFCIHNTIGTFKNYTLIGMLGGVANPKML